MELLPLDIAALAEDVLTVKEQQHGMKEQLSLIEQSQDNQTLLVHVLHNILINRTSRVLHIITRVHAFVRGNVKLYVIVDQVYIPLLNTIAAQ